MVSYERRPLFRDQEAVRLLGDVMRTVRESQPIQTIALVVLTDHIHRVWSLPPGDLDFSTRWKHLKRDFTVRRLESGGDDAGVPASRRAPGERGLWQRRFWEHQVRDEDDLEHASDDIHDNPVKHGHAPGPAAWPWSTFPRFVASGDYPTDWGSTLPPMLRNARDMGA